MQGKFISEWESTCKGGQHPAGQRSEWPKRGGQRTPVWQESHEPREESESFVLRTYIVGGVGVRQLHID